MTSPTTTNPCTKKTSPQSSCNRIRLPPTPTKILLMCSFRVPVITIASRIRNDRAMGRNRMERKWLRMVSIVREQSWRMSGPRASIRICRLWWRMWRIKGILRRVIRMYSRRERNRKSKSKRISLTWITTLANNRESIYWWTLWFNLAKPAISWRPLLVNWRRSR